MRNERFLRCLLISVSEVLWANAITSSSFIFSHTSMKTLTFYGPVTWGGLSVLDLREALKMSKTLGKIQICFFLGQVLNLSKE